MISYCRGRISKSYYITKDKLITSALHGGEEPQVPSSSFRLSGWFDNVKWPDSLWSGPRITRKGKRNFKLLFVLMLLGVETGSEIYVRLPQEIVYGSSPAPLESAVRRAQTDSLVLIFPGAGGPDRYTSLLKSRIEESDKEKGVSRYVAVYDWMKWRGSFFRAAFDAQSVGRKIGTQLAIEELSKLKGVERADSENVGTMSDGVSEDKVGPVSSEMDSKISEVDAPGKKQLLHSIDIIGISVGSFAADSCAKSYRSTLLSLLPKEMKDSVEPAGIRLTLLDPFTSKGVFGYGWGSKNFGKGLDEKKDLVEAYVNTDDPVPTTNDPLSAAFNYDVTQALARSQFIPPPGDSMHSWPVLYLAQHWETEVEIDGKLKRPAQSDRPRGGVQKIP